MSSQSTFVEAVLDGEALPFDIDDWVDAWHEADGAPRGSREALASFLGMSGTEYTMWVKHPETLRYMIAAHRLGRPVDYVLQQADVAAAARSEDDSEAAKVIRWLQRQGHLD